MLYGTGSYSFLGNAFYCYPDVWINFLNKPSFYKRCLHQIGQGCRHCPWLVLFLFQSFEVEAVDGLLSLFQISNLQRNHRLLLQIVYTKCLRSPSHQCSVSETCQTSVGICIREVENLKGEMTKIPYAIG